MTQKINTFLLSYVCAVTIGISYFMPWLIYYSLPSQGFQFIVNSRSGSQNTSPTLSVVVVIILISILIILLYSSKEIKIRKVLFLLPLIINVLLVIFFLIQINGNDIFSTQLFYPYNNILASFFGLSLKGYWINLFLY